MAKKTSLPIDSLDFDGIKDNLKTYLQSQDVFSDYDFEGSGMNILMDLLAYNTHYNAFYYNMVLSESFIDSATRNNSVYSLLKLINYTPSSIVASVATVDIISRGSNKPFGDGILPERVSFTGSPKDKAPTLSLGVSYPYTNPQAVAFEPCAYDKFGNVTEWIAKNVLLVQGEYSSIDYVYDTNLYKQHKIPSLSSDNRWLKVYVRDSESEEKAKMNEWTKSTKIVDLEKSNEVYFLQMGLDGYFEVEFGDDVVSKRPEEGSLVTIDYLVTTGPEANKVGKNDKSGNRVFRLNDNDNGGNYEVIVKQESFGGASKESVQFSKRYGPKTYQSQNRLVTAEDYRTEILKNYPLIKSILVYGGEEMNPPQYGKVFIVANTKSSVPLSNTEKESIIKNIIKKKQILTIIPEFIDIDNTYIRIVMDVLYNDAYTSLSSDALKSEIKSIIQNYTDNELEEFGSSFRGHILITRTADVSPSIVSVNLLVNLEKRIDPALFIGTTKTYQTKFPNGIYKKLSGSSISTNAFTVGGVKSYLQDDGNGILQLYTIDGKGRRVITNSNQGTIDYNTGVVQIKSIKIDNIPNDSFIRVYATAKNNDVFVSQNQILLIDETDPTSSIINMAISDQKPL